MGKIVKLGAVLLAITAITGLILGGIYKMTLEPIRQTKENAKMEALAATLPGAEKFAPLELDSAASPAILEVNKGTGSNGRVGYNVTVSPKGYAGPIEMVVGIANDGTIAGIKILNHTETPGLGAKAADLAFSDQYKDKKVTRMNVVKTPPTQDNEIKAISGATITSQAVTDGVNNALDYFAKHLTEGGAEKAEHETTDAPSGTSKAPEENKKEGND